jgi:two-component system response regulator PilR (NtrC family)
MGKQALLVDDEPTILITLDLILKSRGYEVKTANCAMEAKVCLDEKTFDLVITDLSMEGPLSGYEIVELANRQAAKPATIVLSGYYDLLVEWEQHGASAALAKPTGAEELLATIEHLLPNSKNHSTTVDSPKSNC